MSRPAILGLWDGHDAGAALLVDGALDFALSEERPSRQKRASGFPRMALAAALDRAAEVGAEIQQIALAGRRGRAPQRLLQPLYAGSDPHRRPLAPSSLALIEWENRASSWPLIRAVEPRLSTAAVRARLPRPLRRIPVRAVEHHDAHAFSALLGPDREGALVITADAYGEGRAATVRAAASPGAAAQSWGPRFGLALLFGATTVALGFREGDEGKVMGLAARGRPEAGAAALGALLEDPSPGAAPRLRRRLTERALAAALSGLSVEDGAAGLQALVEARAAAWVAGLLQGRPETRLLLAGGLFANVRLNQRLAELPGVEGSFVFPAMGDGGLAAGAAHLLWWRQTGALAAPLASAALGIAFDEARCRAAAASAGLKVRRVDPARAGAERLATGQVICRFRGRDEHGPRALGQRSILFAPDDPARADRVNDALGRFRYMAFAPILAAEAAPEVLASPLPRADLRWMTCTVDAAPGLAGRLPVAAHVDGTTRPQIVSRDRDPELHALLSAARGRGLAALINTSFNLHGEPIVHTPEDAVRSFQAAGFDALYLGDLEATRG